MSRLRASRVVVTGGAGFIGTHLIKKLASLQVKEIIAIDNFSFGSRKNLNLMGGRIKVIKHTLGGAGDSILFDVLKNTDYVFHLAALKHNQSHDDPAQILKQNIRGTFNLCQAAVKNKVKKVIFSSSLYAYGRMHAPALKESEPAHPATVYGISKLAGEHLLSYFFHQYGLDSVALRYFFVYGPLQITSSGYKTVIVKNFRRIIQNQNPVIYGNGRQVFDYIYIDDVVDATILALDCHSPAEVFNLGSGEPVSVNRLVDLMLKISGKPLRKVHGAADQTQGTYRVADIAKISKALHFYPAVRLEEGLRRTYSWIKEFRR